MSVIYKSKSEYRAEGEKALADFLARGGVVEVVKPKRAPKQKMRAKGTRSGGSSNSSLGYRVSGVFK